MGLVRHFFRLIVVMLFSALSGSMAFAVPMSMSEISFYQTGNRQISQADSVGFAARAPPMAVEHVAFTGAAVAVHGDGIIVHGHETHVASLGFGVGLDAPNSGGAILFDESVLYNFSSFAALSTDPDAIYEVLDVTVPQDLRTYLNTVDDDFRDTIFDPLSLVEARLRGLKGLDNIEKGRQDDAPNRTGIETSNGALVRPADSQNYSVATEVQLPNSAYPGVSRQRHNQISNQALHEAFETDPAYAAQMENLYPGIVDGVRPGPRGAFPRSAPTSDVTWHHGTQPGQMQLVPIDQHTAPGPVQGSLHPNGSGGFSDWGTE